MPLYIPQTRPRKLSLVEAQNLVCAWTQCSVEVARAQLRHMLRDGVLYLDWDPMPQLRRLGRLRRPEFTDIAPPGANARWLDVTIRWTKSKIWDDFEEVANHPGPRRYSEWRTLTVDEESLLEVLRKIADEKLTPEGNHEAPVEPADASGKEASDKDDPPRDTTALRLKAEQWLAQFVADGKHANVPDTLEKMRAQHPGLGVRGSKEVFKKYSGDHPELKLSVPGPKSKR